MLILIYRHNIHPDKPIKTVSGDRVIHVKCEPNAFYPYSGRIIQKSGASTEALWTKEGHTQLPELRAAAIYDYDTPYLDLSAESVEVLGKHLFRLSAYPPLFHEAPGEPKTTLKESID